MTRLLAPILLAPALLLGCDRPEPPPEAKIAPQIDGERITLPPEAGVIETQAVERRDGAVLYLPGRLAWNEDRTSRIFPPFAGRVRAILAKVGDTVMTGQVLAWLEAPEFGQAQSALRKSEADLNLAQKNANRQRALFERGITSRRELDQALTDLAAAQSEAERARTRLSAYGVVPGTVDQRFPIRSPIAGIVVERQLNPGQEVDAADKEALFLVSDPTHFWIILEVPEKDLADVELGDLFTFSVKAYPNQRFSGKVRQINDFIDPQTRTVKVRGEIADPSRRLKAEMYVTAELRLHGGSGLQIPEQAAVLVGDSYYVFVAEAEHTYRRRKIETRSADRGQIPVLSGLAPGERIVVQGALFLQQLLQAAANRG
ncbi:efflux RND transporter periplasmic adaptor subunit [Methylotetracoccus oryzae]|uniref:efflux RND transporter periplasmic adaptor subunit n=1 Tax=Methylotetracoccus oryzae TaxID=1919059 RepID=UPI001118BA58|nr:efflux RND transporter periplasmic adaptor subunit [Methylotetracoccus oryzae]